ncbi:MAG: hypothetical protein QOG52_2067 [Frankiaceae bacterium]|nr:hypothetical protein [Frankiaceae bacterium]
MTDAPGELSEPVTGGGRPRRLLAWVVVLVVLACAAFGGAIAANSYEKAQVRHLVAARGQIERFGDHDTYLLIWNDQIFANLVPIPEGLLASLPEGARLRVYYSPVTQQVVLRSRRYDAPQLLLLLGVVLLAAAVVLPRRARRRVEKGAAGLRQTP